MSPWAWGLVGFWIGFAARDILNDLLDRVPYGYQDDTGFHYGHEIHGDVTRVPRG